MATVEVALEPARAALGSPVEMTFRFTLAPDAPEVPADYRVFVHVLDEDGEKLWNDDHEPTPAPSTWRPGQTVEYTRTTFVPVLPYVGPATIRLGVYSPEDGQRLPLAGLDRGQRSYEVASLDVLPQSESVFLLLRDGWQPSEIAEHDPSLEWQWTRKRANIVFANPRRDAVFFLHYDGRPDLFTSPQEVSLMIGETVLDKFTVDSPLPVVRKTRIGQAAFGEQDKVELTIDVSESFVPAERSDGSRDMRELGIRVYHAYLRPL